MDGLWSTAEKGSRAIVKGTFSYWVAEGDWYWIDRCMLHIFKRDFPTPAYEARVNLLLPMSFLSGRNVG